MPIDYAEADRILQEELRTVENDQLAGMQAVLPSEELVADFDAIFASRTQAFREVLIGCVLARLQDRNIDATLPYVNQGSRAYNGRTLDERVVNPFFRAHRIPASMGHSLVPSAARCASTKKRGKA